MPNQEFCGQESTCCWQTTYYSYLFPIPAITKGLGSDSIANLYARTFIVITGCITTAAIFFYKLQKDKSFSMKMTYKKSLSNLN